MPSCSEYSSHISRNDITISYRQKNLEFIKIKLMKGIKWNTFKKAGRQFFISKIEIFIVLIFFNANFLIACSDDEKKPSIETLNDTIVTLTGKFDTTFGGLLLDFFDPFTGKRQPIKNFKEYTVNTDKTFRVKFPLDKRQSLLIFLKNFWVTPGDSINLEYKVLESTSSKRRDTLIFSGKNYGNYACYTFFRTEYYYNDQAFPKFFLNKKYLSDLMAYKKDMDKFYIMQNRRLDSFFRKNETTDSVRLLIKKELNCQKLLALLDPYSTGKVRKKGFPISYLDEYSVNDFLDSVFLESKYFCSALREYHRFAADEDVTSSWFSSGHLAMLYNDAQYFRGKIREFLYWSDLDWFSKNYNSGYKDEINKIYKKIISEVTSIDLQDKIEQLGWAGIGKYPGFSKEFRNIQIKDVNGNVIKLGELIRSQKGKVIYLDFWASWCTPCRKEIPYGKKLLEYFPSKDFSIIYLSQDENENSWIKAVNIEKMSEKNSYRFLSNEDLHIAQTELKFTAIPYYTLINTKGELAFMNAPRPSETSKIIEYVNNLFKNDVQNPPLNN